MKERKLSSKTQVLALIVVNALIVLVLEGGFRVFGSGESTRFLLREEIGDTEYLRLNPSYAKTFSTRINPLVPIPLNHSFARAKGQDTYRIYVLGESTSQGFPYPRTGAFPYQLQQMLNNAGTDKRFEVINMSMTAITTHVGLDMARQVVDYAPDAVILYFGHNEFIGIGGSGTWNSPLFRANRVLSHSWAYQTLKAQLSKLRKEDYRSLLEKRSRDEVGVSLESEVYRSTLRQFAENYEGMLRLFRENEIPVISCGVVENTADLPPLMASEGVNRQILSEAGELIRGPESGDRRDELASLVGDDAHLSYQVADLLLGAGNTELARSFLDAAVDLDQLRLRASSDINETIRALAEEYGSAYVDVEAIFEGKSPQGIVGNSLMLEHVHPTVDGHYLIARSLAEAILSNILDEQPKDGYDRIPIYLTLVDHIGTSNSLFNLFRSFPYDSREYINAVGFEPVFDTASEGFISLLSQDDLPRFFSEAQDYLRRDVNPNEYREIVGLYFELTSPAKVHVNYGVQLAARKKYEEAYREFLVAAEQNEDNSYALNNMGVLHFEFDQPQEASGIFEKLCDRSPEFLGGCENYWFVLNKMGKRAEADAVGEYLKKKGVNVESIDHVTLYRYDPASD